MLTMKNQTRLNLIVLSAMLIAGEKATAGDSLQQGIGMYQLGQRSYSEQLFSYDQNGEKVPLGSRFDRNFDGQTLLSGKAGAELKRLADELKRYEGSNPQAEGLLNRINLGSMTGDVKANVNARFLGLGFGLNDSLMVFMAVPFVTASVESEISFDGNNNAQAIKSELGDLAFEELKQGLDRASQLNEQQLRQSILDAGYAPFETWEHKGYGDIRLGLKTGFASRMAKGLKLLTSISPVLEIPTGYVENPDLLTDISFGKGYYSLGIAVDERLVMARTFWIGVDGSFAENFNAKMKKRVPVENETLPTADRKTTVSIAPGDDVDTAGSVGATFGWVSASYRAGVKRHFKDGYSGALSGNYEALSENSDKYQLYQQAKLTFSTAGAYKRKSFPVPLILSLSANQPLEAKNSSDEKYYELSIASFFKTAMARDTEVRSASKKKKRNRNSFLTTSHH